MRQGMGLEALESTLLDVERNAVDYSTDIGDLEMDNSGLLGFKSLGRGFKPTPWAGLQLARYTDIPKRYYDKISVESPELLARNVNHSLGQIFKHQPDAKRIVRTIGEDVRALVSKRFRPIDSAPLFRSVMPGLEKLGFKYASGNLNQTRMNLKFTKPSLRAVVGKGDVVEFGIHLRNSDVGNGSLVVEFFVTRLVCLNGMILDAGLKKYHVGRAHDGNLTEILSQETLNLNNEALFKTINEIIANTADPTRFHSLVEKLNQSTERTIEKPVTKVIESSMKMFGVSGDGSKDRIIEAMASGNQGAGLTQYGLAQSFSRASQSGVYTYEEATNLEKVSGKIIELDGSAWSRLAA